MVHAMTASRSVTIDFLDKETLIDPYTPLAALRDQDPVHWSEKHRSWVITRYDDVLAGIKSNDLSVELGDEFLANIPDDHPLRRYIQKWMLFTGPPDHKRLRGLVAKAFTPGVISALGSQVHTVVNELIRKMSQKGSGDFMRDFASPLPAIVIAELFGLPQEDHEQIGEWSSAISAVTFREVGIERFNSGAEAIRNFATYLLANIERVRAHPKDDLLSRLVHSREQGDLLSDDELVSTVMLFLFGGHETSTSLLGNGLASLTTHSHGIRSLRELDTMEMAVDELLRFDGPGRFLVRHAKIDFELRGKTIKCGERVFLAISAANRDPEVFSQPDTLDLQRTPNRHLGFGMGAHYCLGANLAKLEAGLGFQTLAKTLPSLRIDLDKLKWRPTMLARTIQTLPYSL
jgi:cytochrome P450